MGSGFRFQNCSQYQQLTSLCRDDQTPITQILKIISIKPSDLKSLKFKIYVYSLPLFVNFKFAGQNRLLEKMYTRKVGNSLR